jgi:hypothetical protein
MRVGFPGLFLPLLALRIRKRTACAKYPAMTDFDPYYKWLAIPPNEQPPNHYRLLGVPLFTADADVIDNAADQRMTHLRSYQSGKHSAESQRLLNEVSQARACLLVPEKRAEYDAALKKKLQPASQPVQPIQQPVQPIQQPYPQQQPGYSQQQPLQPVQQPLPQINVRPIIPQFVAPTVAPTQPQFGPVQPQFSPPQPAPAPIRTPIPVQQPPIAPVEPTPAIAVNNTRKRKQAGPDATRHIAASFIGLLLGYFIVCLIMPRYDVFGMFHKRPADPPPVSQNTVSQNSVAPDPTPPKLEPVTPKPVTPPSVNPQIMPVKPPVTPTETKKIETVPATTKINETPKTETKPSDPPPTVPMPSDTEQQQARIAKLKADRAAAVEKNEISAVLLMTDELAKLEATDALVERGRMIDELRKSERSPAEVVLLTTQLLDIVAAASKSERHEFATEQATAALLLARKSGDQELVKKATKCKKKSRRRLVG